MAYNHLIDLRTHDGYDLLSENAIEFLNYYHEAFPFSETAKLYWRTKKVQPIAIELGWGWHRTNNTLKELGLR